MSRERLIDDNVAADEHSLTARPITPNQELPNHQHLLDADHARESHAPLQSQSEEQYTDTAEPTSARSSEHSPRSSAEEMGDSRYAPNFQRRRSNMNPNSNTRPGTARSKASHPDSILEDGDAPASSEHSMEMDPMASDDDMLEDEETGLTHAQRKKKRRWKNRNTHLGERIAGAGADGEYVDEDDKKERSEERQVYANMVKDATINAILIGSWYGFSISISVYNKWMFSAEKNNLNFHFPLFSTSLHMLVQFTLSSIILYSIPALRPKPMPIERGEYSSINDDNTLIATTKPLMTRLFYLTRIGPCGTATALDIGLGNFSLRFITLTFYTMCKSSVLAFVLLFAFIFRLETPTWKLIIVILCMTVGVIMMVAGETAFNALGFILVMSASFCSGFRWSLTQILLLHNPATSNPFSSIFFLTPVMFIALFTLALPIEGAGAILGGIRDLIALKGSLLGLSILLFPGLLAFLMVSAEFALLKRTSVVTLSVCGIFKEVLTISAAGLVFGDALSPINVSGLLVTIASIAGYNVLKYQKMREDAHALIQGNLMNADHQRRHESAVRRGEGRGGGSSEVQHGVLPDGSHIIGYEQVNGNGNASASAGPAKRPQDVE